jgi:tetratricopeptide (TPR) repeat protein
MRLKLLIIIAIVACVTANSYSQVKDQAFLDSLVRELPKFERNINKCRLLDTISLLFNNIKPQKGIDYGRMGAQLSEELGWKKGVAKAYGNIGACHRSLLLNDSAIFYYKKALLQFQEMKDLKSEAEVYTNMGNLYSELSDHNNSMVCYSNALDLYKKENNLKGMLRVLGNIAANLCDQGKYEEALHSYYSALKIATDNNIKNEMARSTFNIANIYCSLDSLQKALEFEYKAVDLYSKLGDNKGKAISLINTGAIYLVIAKDTTGKYLARNSQQELARNLANAIEFLKKGVASCNEAAAPEALSQCYQMLSDAYLFKGDEKESYKYYKLFAETKDSITEISNKNAIANMEDRIDRSLKDNIIFQLELRNKRNERLF